MNSILLLIKYGRSMRQETKKTLKSYGIAAVIGALIGFSLSFAALSPLIIGGIISFVSTYSFLMLITPGKDSLKYYEETSRTKLIAGFFLYLSYYSCSRSWSWCSYRCYFSCCNVKYRISSFDKCNNRSYCTSCKSFCIRFISIDG